MVTYFIVDRNDNFLTYKYYPENDTDKSCGIIKVDIPNKEFSVLTVAEEDFLCITTAAELNEMRDAINKMQLEIGEAPLTEEELPIAYEDEEWYFYASRVISKLKKELGNGIIPESGKVVWY